MTTELTTAHLIVEGMVCNGCEMIIENQLKNINGIIEVKATYANAQINIRYHDELITIPDIVVTIEELEYKVLKINGKDEQTHKKENKTIKNKFNMTQFMGIIIVIIALYFFIN